MGFFLFRKFALRMREQIGAIAIQHESEQEFRIHPWRRNLSGRETLETGSQGLLELHEDYFNTTAEETGTGGNSYTARF